LPRISTEGGIQIDVNEHDWKHESPILINRDLGSKRRLSITELAKQESPRNSTDDGTQMEFNEQLAKQFASIRLTATGGSNLTSTAPEFAPQ
jgi:hypothetical protein